MSITEGQSRYSIAALLDTAIQPFKPMPDDELAALAKAIGKNKPLADPVSMTGDGSNIVIDGSQRLRAMLRAGRKFIDARDIRHVDGATRENALEWAIRLNAQRRSLTVEEKATMARELQKERGWSQAMIARAFGVSRPAVTQWLGKTRQLTEGEVPATVMGADGRRYDGEAVSGRPSPRPPKLMWKPGGAAYNAVRVARNKLGSEPYGALDTLAQAKLAQLIDDLIEAAENFRAAMAEHVPAVPAVEPAEE